jgi:hypothetical protein
MTPDRTLLCYTIAVIAAFATALGTQLLAGIATGDYAGALRQEPVDLSVYWLVALPVCYAVAGVLGYLGPVRTWRWIAAMLAIHALYTLVSAGSGLSLWPLALAMYLVIALPGILTGWLGGLIRRRWAPAGGGV